MLLQKLLGAVPLGEALQQTADANAAEELPVGDWFARWAKLGLIANV